MANPDTSRQVDMAGNDEVVMNERTRATRVAVTTQFGSNSFPANPVGVNWQSGIGTPFSTSVAANTTLLVPAIFSGVATIKSTAAGTTINVTTDTAQNIVSALNATSSGAQVGDYVSCLLVNGSSTAANTLTLVGGSGVTLDGNQANAIVLVGASKQLLFRMTNVTVGSETCILYC